MAQMKVDAQNNRTLSFRLQSGPALLAHSSFLNSTGISLPNKSGLEMTGLMFKGYDQTNNTVIPKE